MSITERIEFLKAEHRKLSSERNLTEWTLNCEKKELEIIENQLKEINLELETLMRGIDDTKTDLATGSNIDAFAD